MFHKRYPNKDTLMIVLEHHKNALEPIDDTFSGKFNDPINLEHWKNALSPIISILLRINKPFPEHKKNASSPIFVQVFGITNEPVRLEQR